MNDIFEGFSWHSCIGIDFALDGSKEFATRLPKTARTMDMFASGGGDSLIHKTTKALWRVSEDGNYIEPTHATDILTAEDLEEAE